MQNIDSHGGLFASAILWYLIDFSGDIVIARALHVLLAFFYPALNLDWFFFVSFAELLLPLWLVIMDRSIKQPDSVYGAGNP